MTIALAAALCLASVTSAPPRDGCDDDALNAVLSTSAPEGARRFVIGTSVNARRAPSASAAVVAKLGYGTPVTVVAQDCGDDATWLLVGTQTRGAGGFIKQDLAAPALLSLAELSQRETLATNAIEKGVWAVQRAHLSKSPADIAHAEALQSTARASLTRFDKNPCETFLGACKVLAEDRPDNGVAPLSKDVAAVPVGPWWVLPRDGGPAQIGVFRMAYVYVSGECDGCGLESCQTTLNVELNILGTDSRPYEVVGASQKPPESWFLKPTGDCNHVEATVRKSSSWKVPRWKKIGPEAATKKGKCISGTDGSAIWIQRFAHDELRDQESGDTVARVYRVKASGVVEDFATTIFSADADGTTTSETTPAPLVWRDVDGDGTAEGIYSCAYGRYCTEKTSKARGGMR